MLKETITDKRKERHSVTQEDFTPDGVVNDLLSRIPEEAYTDFSKTILDPACGTGNILNNVLLRRLENTETPDQAIDALSTLYGVELMQDNVDEHKDIIRTMLTDRYPDIDMNAVDQVLAHNIVCDDFFHWL